jgi:hypothetical protein
MTRSRHSNSSSLITYSDTMALTSGTEMAFANTHASMVAVGDAQLQCYEAGSGDPVLLVSGWPESALTWERVIPLLASDYRVIAVEPPALGLSHPTSCYDMQSVAALFRERVQKLGLPRLPSSSPARSLLPSAIVSTITSQQSRSPYWFGRADIGDQINKKILGPLAQANSASSKRPAGVGPPPAGRTAPSAYRPSPRCGAVRRGVGAERAVFQGRCSTDRLVLGG